MDDTHFRTTNYNLNMVVYTFEIILDLHTHWTHTRRRLHVPLQTTETDYKHPPFDKTEHPGAQL